MTASPDLLPPEVVARLQRLRVALRQRVEGRFAGAHASRRHGSSLEFADHREYVAGDDLRRVDLAAYRRLGRLLVRQYEAEDEAAVRVVVDRSASMRFRDKARAARQVAAALGVLAGAGQDRVRILLAGPVEDGVTGGGAQAVDAGPWFRGAQALTALSARLASGMPDGPGRPPAPGEGADPAAALVAGVRRARGEGPVGPVVVVSDLLFDGWASVLEALAAGRGDGVVVQVVGRTDLEPDVDSDLRLVDVETGEEVTAGADNRALGAHADARDAWLHGVAADCGRRGLGHVLVVDDDDVDELVTATLRSLGLVA